MASLAEITTAGDTFSSRFDIEYQREVYCLAAENVRELVSVPTWNAFHLTHVEGVSIESAATQPGVTIGRIYIARSRVMNRLRELAAQFRVIE